MPFTPFHFGTHASIAFPLNKKVDLPIFILANVVIDIEPLLVMIFNLSYPLHGYAHTFIGATIIGLIWGIIAYKGKKIINQLMAILNLPYRTTLKKAIISGWLGNWLHILFDAPLYTDIKPFFPINKNPFYGLVTNNQMYNLCTLLFLPALIFYIITVIQYRKLQLNKSS